MRASRAFAICSTMPVAAVLGACLFAAENQPPASKTPDLTQRVAVLEEKVAGLEKTLAQFSLPASPLAVPPAVPGPIYSPPAQAAPQNPPNGIPYQFNGQTYFITPLGSRPNGVATSVDSALKQ